MRRPVALITGASAGIGAEFARALAKRSYDLVIVARRRERLDALAEELTAKHPAIVIRVVACDLAETTAAEQLASGLERDGVAVDLLVNNAGFGSHGAFVTSDPANAAGQIALNIATLVALSRAFLPGMVERRSGGIINLSSTAGFQPVPNMAVYGATKAFVLSFSEALHEEVRRSGVRVMALCPGATETEFFTTAGERAAVGPRRSAAGVVATGLRAFERNRAVAVDGFANAALATMERYLPRDLVTRVAGVMMGAT